MTTQEFFAKYDGRRIDFDGNYGAQCMDLAAQYIQEVVGVSGWSIGRATAYQVWSEFDAISANQIYDKIPNTPEGVPQAGDIVVWDTSIGSAGHIAVATGQGDTNNFTSFDQNWPGGSASHYQSHNYNGVVGWLRLKNKQGGQPMAETKEQAENRLLHGPGGIDDLTIQNYNLGVQLNNLRQTETQLRKDVDTIAKQVKDLQAQVAGKDKQIADLNTLVAQKDADIQNLKNAGKIPVDNKWELFKSLIKELLK